MRRLLTLSIAILLTACSAVTPAVSTSTPLPSPNAASGEPTTAPTATKKPAADQNPTATLEATLPPPTDTPAATATPAPGPSGGVLSGTVWEWQSLEPASGSPLSISDPNHYALVFQGDGSLNLQADCAVTGGTYLANGASLQIQPTTPAALNCLDGSHAGAFLKNLANTASYDFKDGYLVLTLQGGGVMKLAPQAIVNPSAAVPGDGTALAKTFATVRSGPGLNFPVYGVFPAGASAELGGRNFDSGWWGLKMPGYPDALGWVPPSSITVSNPDKVPYLQLIFLMSGEKLLWPDVSDPRASTNDPIFIYTGPGKPYPVFLMGLPGDTFFVIGRSADSQYLVIYLGLNPETGGIGWVATKDVESHNWDGVPVFPAPALPAKARAYQPSDSDAVAAGRAIVNLRSGPDTGYPVLTTAERGQILHIIGQSQDRMWWVVEVSQGVTLDRKAYVAQSITRAVNADNVPVVEDPFEPQYGQFEKVGPSCTIVRRTPLELQIFTRGEDFGAEFEVLNNTDKDWPDGGVDFVFIGDMDNAPIHLGANRYKITDTIAPGQTATLKFSAEAVKKHAGTFGELWVVRQNGKTICSFSYLIRVKDQ
jgi:uncharacterized protein YraI